MIKHITEYSYDKGHPFNGFRVTFMKKGVIVRQYISSRDIGRVKALARAIELEANIARDIKGCRTADEVLEVKEKYEKHL